ncbi:uncharacterized protein LOC120850154 [Ixodes scapularis]|uniref:uncharacterized protein LOC120850154 n=1 Tax=Ixodes scapularis TaxID=6945 RepID=UPI001A9F0C51|nr:uncharacterized protein LOC120850154 [Ixodes scapularis]
MATPPIVIAENDTSANTTAAGHLDNGQQPAEAGTSGKLVDGSKGNHDNSTSNDTSDSDMTTSGPEDQDDEDFISVKTGRKRKRKIESASDEESRKKAIVSLGLTVIFAPQDPTILLNKLNGLKLTEALNSHAPTEVGEIRCNKRLNILAVDTRNQESTASLLRIRKLVGIAVRAYEPRNPNTAVGIIRDVDASISEKVLLRNLSANMTKITQVRRFADTETVRVTFASATLPEHVFLGRVRHKVELYVDRPAQCRKCGKFGHVKPVCTRPEVCTRCSGSHASERCEAERAKCVNCKGAHEATSKDCVIWQQERAVNKYKTINKVDFKTARAAVRSRGQRNIEHDNLIVLQNRFSDLYDETQDLPPRAEQRITE